MPRCSSLPIVNLLQTTRGTTMTSETPTPNEDQKETQIPREEEAQNQEPKKRSFLETIETLKASEQIDTLYSYAKSNTLDTAAYIAMILGIVWLFFNSFWGGLLVGTVFGFYYADEISLFLKNANTLIEENGMVRSLVLGGLLLSFLIMAPGILIGTAVIVALKQLLLK